MTNTSNDFKDGIAFCELIGSYKGKPLNGVNYSNPKTKEKSIMNIKLAIQQIASITNTNIQISAEDVYNDENAMYELLETIKKMFDQKNRQEDQLPSPCFKTVNPKEYTEEENFHIHNPEIVNNESSPYEAYKGKIITPRELPQRTSNRENNIISASKTNIRQLSIDSKLSSNTKSKIKAKTKNKIIDWFHSISLLKKSSIAIEEFPSYCRNGVLIYDLIMRLEGRQMGSKTIKRMRPLDKCAPHLESITGSS